jgi:hypothetical protein
MSQPEPISATSSTTRPRAKAPPLFSASPYTLAKRPDGVLGLWGGVLLKPLKLRVGGWRVGEDLMPGTVVPGDVTSEWPLQNRLAMASGGFIRYFQTEAESDTMAEIYAEQIQRSPLHAAHDAAEERDNQEMPQAKKDPFAAARAAKALKALQAKLAAAEAQA